MKMFPSLNRSAREKSRRSRQLGGRRNRLLRAEALEDRRLLAAVSVFDDPAFVDSDGTAFSESDNVQASLTSLGHTVNAFTGTTAADFSDAIAASDILLIPELERGFLGSSLSTAAKNVIGNHVAGGGGMIVHGGSNVSNNADQDFLNSVFEFSVSTRASALSRFTTSNLSPGDAAGTEFAGGPATIPNNDATHSILAGAPSGTQHVYTHSTETTVALLPFGGGKIAYIGFDWFNAAPVGSQDGGWLQVLDSSVGEVSATSAPPEAQDDSYEVDEDNTLTVDAADGVLDNDSDPDSDPLTATSVVTAPSNGTVTLDGDGSFEYVPGPDFHGQDSFVYEVSDGNGGTDTATVNITVHSVIDAQIDVRPGSDPNPVNLNSKGILPVAVLSTQTANGELEDFDATMIDTDTIELNGVEIDPFRAAFEDVDDDGDLDLMLHFRTPELVNEGGLDEDSVDLALTAEFAGGNANGFDLEGSDSVRIVPSKGKGKGKSGK